MSIWVFIFANSQCSLHFFESIIVNVRSHAHLFAHLVKTHPRFQVEVRCDEATKAVMPYVYVNVRILTAQLQTIPSSLSGNAIIGKQTSVSFQVKNIGMAPTGPLTVSMSNLPFLSLGIAPTLASIAPGNSTLVTVLISPAAGTDVALMTASVGVTGEYCGAVLSMSYSLVTNSTGDLTVVCEDEFTYFAQDAPRVANATVTIVNLDGSVHLSMLSDENGTALFSDIPESYWKITVQKLGHATFTETRKVDGGGLTVRAFLQRELVSYTWVVRQTEVTETYTFELQATYVTQVPAPVVTIEPMYIDLADLELQVEALGETTLTFKLTNHGLITASNTTISLPQVRQEMSIFRNSFFFSNLLIYIYVYYYCCCCYWQHKMLKIRKII